MDITSYLLGKKSGGGGGPTPQTYLLKEMDIDTSVAGLTLSLDTANYTSQQLINGLQSGDAASLATFGTQDEGSAYMLFLSDGASLSEYLTNFATSAYKPNGNEFGTINSTHFYIWYLAITEEGVSGVYVLADLSTNTIYGDTTLLNSFVLLELYLSHFPESVVWNCLKLKESGVTPTGTIGIDSNGTYNVTNFASADVNVPVGGNGGLSIQNQIINLIKPESDYASNTAITLYTPDADCTSYVIRKKSNGKYNCVWLNGAVFGKSGSSFLLYTFIIPNITKSFEHSMSTLFGGGLQWVSSPTTYGASFAYVGSEFDAISEVIDAMKNPNSTYEYLSTTSGFGFAAESDYILPYCNTMVYFQDNNYSSTYGYGCVIPNRQISSNETIRVIGQ